MVRRLPGGPGSRCRAACRWPGPLLTYLGSTERPVLRARPTGRAFCAGRGVPVRERPAGRGRTSRVPRGVRIDGEREVRPVEAARQRGHHRPRRSRQDHPHRRHHQGPGREGQRRHRGRVVRRDRQGPRGARARHHDRDGPRRVRDREPSLRARGLPGSRRLHQEHDHRRRPDGRRDPRRVGRRRPHAADARAHPARPPGRRAVDRGLPQQGRHGRRRGAARAGRARGARAAVRVRVPRRRHPDHQGLGAERPQRRRRGGRGHPRADGRGRRLHPAARSATSTSRS